MALFDALIDDLASRFGLGATAAPLTREALALIVGAEGGLAGFLNLFKGAGFDAQVGSWLGRSDPQPVTAGDLGKALGAPAIDGIAHRVGIALPAASAGLAYALPRLVGTLTPNGVVPAALPAEVIAFLAPEAAHAAAQAPQATPVADHGATPVADPGHASGQALPVKPIRPRAAPGWLWPLVGVGSLAALGWGVWPLLFPAAPLETGATHTPAPAPAPAKAEAQAPAAAAATATSASAEATSAPAAAAGPSTLSVDDKNGVAEVSGSVPNDRARASILDTLKSVYGADAVRGDIAVDPNRAAAPWLANLRAALDALKVPGLKATFAGGALTLSGAVPDLDRDKIAAALKSALGDGVTIAGLDRVGNAAPSGAAKTTAAAAAQPSTAPAAAAQPSTAPASAAPAPAAAAQPSTAPASAAPAPAAAAQPSTLSIDDEANGVTVSGAVPDNQTHDSILAALKSVFGADAVKGDIAVDPNRAAAPWLAKLREALAALKIPGLHAMFDGDAVTIGGAIPDRAQVVGALKSVFGDGVTVGALTDSVGDWATAANAKAAEALGKLKSGFSAADVVSALNLSIVNFATDSAEAPSTVAGLLQNAANDLKALPPGYEIEVAGYTDSTGDANGNLVLSQKRAEAVRDALVKDGAPADMLTAKGYGAANPVAGNDTDEGRFRNRRIEYHIVKSPS